MLHSPSQQEGFKRAIDTEKAGPPAGDRSGLVDRVKRILLEPKVDWGRIDAEPTSVGEIFRGWVLIFAAIPSVAGAIGGLLFGYSAFRVTYRPSGIETAGSEIGRAAGQARGGQY